MSSSFILHQNPDTQRSCSYSPGRRAPKSRHFPYTTLFRSGGGIRRGRGVLVPRSHHQQRAGGGGGLDRVVHHLRVADRKSTRLNSSHLVMSYAVFCLIKKNLSLRTSLLECSSTIRK